MVAAHQITVTRGRVKAGPYNMPFGLRDCAALELLQSSDEGGDATSEIGSAAGHFPGGGSAARASFLLERGG